MIHPELHNKVFLALLVAVSIAFGWILLPFYGAVFWAAVLAILFAPLHNRLLVALKMRRNLAASLTLLFCVLMVVIPVTLLVSSLIHEASGIYQRLRTGDINVGAYVQQVLANLPPWMTSILDRLGLNDIGAIQKRMLAGSAQTGQFIASHAANVGQLTMDFFLSFGIMLYVLFFLLRDGGELVARIKQAIPLDVDYKRNLFIKFTTVIQATVKGNVIVAAVQGMLGGIIFAILGIPSAILWGTAMAFLSLLPAIGAALIWAPVAIYFLVTGVIWKGIALAAFGVFVIGLIDNILRPILVGKDTQIPDYVILVSTVGGMALFGLNGFVIGPTIAALFIAVWGLFAVSEKEPPNNEPVPR